MILMRDTVKLRTNALEGRILAYGNMNQDERSRKWRGRMARRELKEKTSRLDISCLNHWTRVENSSFGWAQPYKSPPLINHSALKIDAKVIVVCSSIPALIKQPCARCFSSMYSSRTSYLLLPPRNRLLAETRRKS